MVDFLYYKEVYLGKLIANEEDFRRNLRKAEKILNLYTFGRYYKVEDERLVEMVKDTLCELAENEFSYSEINNVKSYSQGKRSITYADSKDLESNRYNIVRVNLLSSGLLYRGVSNVFYG